MAERGVIFSRGDAERVARAVKSFERAPVDMRGPRLPRAPRIPSYVHIQVTLVQDSGSQGSASAAATYAYHCYWPWDTAQEHKLNRADDGAAVQPARGRAFGRVEIADEGVGYFGDAGAFVLWDTNELRKKGACP